MVASAMTLLSAASAMAMSCYGGKGKGTMMCSKGGSAMNHAGMKGKEGGCCCEGMAGNMSRRS